MQVSKLLMTNKAISEGFNQNYMKCFFSSCFSSLYSPTSPLSMFLKFSLVLVCFPFLLHPSPMLFFPTFSLCLPSSSSSSLLLYNILPSKYHMIEQHVMPLRGHFQYYLLFLWLLILYIS